MKRRWQEVQPDFAGEVARQVGGGQLKTTALAVEAKAKVDGKGRAHRFHIVYADGWRVTLAVRRDGRITISQARKDEAPGCVLA